MTTPNADHEAIIVYTVRQRTTSPKLWQVAERFEKELRLQFASTVDVKVVEVRDANVRAVPWAETPVTMPPVTVTPHDRNSADGPDYGFNDRPA